MEKYGISEQDKPITILEVSVTNTEDIQIIKAADHDYRLTWRRKIDAIRCSLHHMPLGVRGFGVDLFMQDTSNESNLVIPTSLLSGIYK